MEFGKWELRSDSFYWLSKDSQLYPSSNATDEGKLHTEDNVRNIYRDLTTNNFVTKYHYFSLTINATRTGLIVSPGEAVIQGYHFYAKNSVEVKVPNNSIYDDSGRLAEVQPITQYTLGISLSYDAANHVTGDVVNKETEVGESEVLSGVYLKWFDECQLECHYDNILVLGRAWVQKGAIVPDGTEYVDFDGKKRIILHGYDIDPFKDHKFKSKDVEVQIYGHSRTIYDSLADNISQIHSSIYSYDSMHFPIDTNRQTRTKPPTHNTDIQDFISHLPDWYVSKYGDYMTGALRFNNLSIDAIREFTDSKLGVFKDSVSNNYSDSIIISPRTYGDLTRYESDSVEKKNYDYDVGGTILSIVPSTYPNTADHNDGYTGIHAALLSQKHGDVGLRLHFGTGNESGINNTTRLVHYNVNDVNNKYNNDYIKKDDNLEYLNTSKFIIENIDANGRKSSINMKNGEIFIDSFTKPLEDNKINESINNEFSGENQGSGIQFYVSGSDNTNNIDFRIDESKISFAEHKYENHRTGTRGTVHTGSISDVLHFEAGL